MVYIPPPPTGTFSPINVPRFDPVATFGTRLQSILGTIGSVAKVTSETASQVAGIIKQPLAGSARAPLAQPASPSTGEPMPTVETTGAKAQMGLFSAAGIVLLVAFALMVGRR